MFIMGVYQKLCYKVEDLFVGLLSRNRDQVQIRQKVADYREDIEEKKRERQLQKAARLEEQRLQEEARFGGWIK